MPKPVLDKGNAEGWKKKQINLSGRMFLRYMYTVHITVWRLYTVGARGRTHARMMILPGREV